MSIELWRTRQIKNYFIRHSFSESGRIVIELNNYYFSQGQRHPPSGIARRAYFDTRKTVIIQRTRKNNDDVLSFMLNKCINYLDYLKDAIFPLFCINCNLEGNIICEFCFKKINSDGLLCCPVCHIAENDGWSCSGCKSQSNLDRQIAISEYNEAGLLGQLLQSFKYKYIEDARLKVLGLTNDFVKKNFGLFSKIDVIVPIPLHPRRFAERGFNQADIIADELAFLLKISKFSCLARMKYTNQQAKLKKQERKDNVENAFAFIGKNLGARSNVLLVDDVYTTGSTMQECACVLKINGAKRVVGFTVARG